MESKIELLTAPTNYAIVQLPERKHPGVVFQGDSLFSLSQQIEEIRQLARGENKEELLFVIELLQRKILALLAEYEQVCLKRGIALPYEKTQP
jgi:hypothetical protein